MFLNLRTQLLLVMMAPAIVLVGTTSAQAASIVPGSLTDAQFQQIMANGQFKETFVTEARIGDNGTARTFEQSLLKPTSATNATLTPVATGQRTWTKGAPVTFKLTYDGTLLKYTIGNQTLSTTTITGGATDMFIRTRASSNSRMDLKNMVFTDAAGSINLANLSSAGNGTASDVDYLRLNKIKGAFTITGDSTMNWTGTTPTNSELIYQFKVGTSKSTPEPTTLGALAIVGGVLAARRRQKSA